jgi:uncharacterized protein with PIN domain
MVRIIDATPHQSVVKKKVCRHCGVTLEYVPNDIQERRVTDYDGSSELIKYIECPACKTHVDVRY